MHSKKEQWSNESSLPTWTSWAWLSVVCRVSARWWWVRRRACCCGVGCRVFRGCLRVLVGRGRHYLERTNFHVLAPFVLASFRVCLWFSFGCRRRTREVHCVTHTQHTGGFSEVHCCGNARCPTAVRSSLCTGPPACVAGRPPEEVDEDCT